jgi:thiamine biosynthesis lipoprotein
LAFGTEIGVTLRSDDRPAAEAALRELGEAFQRMHADWHPWEAGALVELNRALATGAWSQPGPGLLAMVEDAQRFERDSLGHFNAAIGGLVALWGFHTSDYPIQAPPPDESRIRRWLTASPSMLDLEIRGHQVRSRNPSVRLDFSGLAKGHAARRACDLLQARALGDALINLGGDVMICGPGSRPWSVAISDGQGGVFAGVDLYGPMAVFSSGTALRWGKWEGGRYAHLLDPRTGQALAHSIQATIIDRDPILADAAATALAVAGPEHWLEVAASMGVSEALLLDASGPAGISEAMAGRLRGEPDS